MRGIALLLAISTTVFAAPVPKDRQPPPDEQRILGFWNTIRVEADGKTHQTSVWEFQEKKMFAQQQKDGSPTSVWIIPINPKKSPKEIMIGPYPGIYEFDGDTLKICYAYDTNPQRPTKFETDNKANINFNVLHRVAAPNPK